MSSIGNEFTARSVHARTELFVGDFQPSLTEPSLNGLHIKGNLISYNGTFEDANVTPVVTSGVSSNNNVGDISEIVFEDATTTTG